MKEIKNILVVGLGAIGTVVAAKLQNAGFETCALCDVNRKERYERDNFYINEKLYKFNYVTINSYDKKADFVIVATKYYSLKDAVKGLDSIVSDDTVVMSLLNGIDSEEIIGEVVGKEKMVYAFSYQNDATKIKNKNTYTSSGIITYGEKSGEKSERTNSIAKVFETANINYELTDNILEKMWWKYMTNIGLNQVSSILDAPYGVFLKNDEIWSLTKRAMSEAVMIAKLKGIVLNKDSTDKVYTMLTKLAPEGKTSMHQDVNAKRKTEVDMLAGQLCKMGEELNIKTPVNKVLYEQLKAIESMY